MTPEQRQRQTSAEGRAAIRTRWDMKQQRPAPTARELFEQAATAVLAARPAKPKPPPKAAPPPVAIARAPARRVQVPCNCGACPYCGATPAHPTCRSHGVWRSIRAVCQSCDHPVIWRD